MKAFNFLRPLRGACRRPCVSVLCALLLLAAQAWSQQPSANVAQSDVHAGPTPLSKLVEEARASNPEILASVRGYEAATHVPKQAGALPDTQVTVQQFAVGSPRPFAGYTNSEFAYIGLGASQEIPYPGKRGLRAQVANTRLMCAAFKSKRCAGRSSIS